MTAKAESLNDSTRSFRVGMLIDDHTSKIVIKSIILKQLMNRSGDSLKLSDVKSIDYLGTFNLKGLKASRVYKIKLSYSLPDVWHYSLALVIANHGDGYLIDLDLIELIKSEEGSSEYYFAGRYKNRYRYGIFKIFNFKNKIMYQIFESREYVSNYSLDCESYENDDLIFQNVDLNNDGYLDLKFSGVKNFYCKRLEQYGREERRPIKKERITIIYYFNKENSTWQSSNRGV